MKAVLQPGAGENGGYLLYSVRFLRFLISFHFYPGYIFRELFSEGRSI
jgi:hypothetical protein